VLKGVIQRPGDSLTAWKVVSYWAIGPDQVVGWRGRSRRCERRRRDVPIVADRMSVVPPSPTPISAACLHTSRWRTRRIRTSSLATPPRPLAASSPSAPPSWPLPGRHAHLLRACLGALPAAGAQYRALRPVDEPHHPGQVHVAGSGTPARRKQRRTPDPAWRTRARGQHQQQGVREHGREPYAMRWAQGLPRLEVREYSFYTSSDDVPQVAMAVAWTLLELPGRLVA
jgi:hypothetical protein